MGKGARTGTNFSVYRRLTLNIVDKMRRLVDNNVYDRPRWLEWAEITPPLENRNLMNTDRNTFNAYLPLISRLLAKYPHLRFHNCYSQGNEFTKGNDRYNEDHHVMRFVKKQMEFINQGFTKRKSFELTEKHFYRERMEIEKNLKINAALGIDECASTGYTSGYQLYNEKRAQDVARSLHSYLTQLRGSLNGYRGKVRPKK
ncbi:conserved Plasmodium protein, unknown function [Babesia microti strain RI]|uniref:Small ribosomal subunit protein mS23 n=1 Tax=Babesia microti (strain RI) TaxID=1133968 RepID=A0A1N6LXF1_BABMR|nr:conserved Plasmodium protein, unknown function [Babesia microti strain RI]SIO73559.1 conserved Plasmodium protein, unknown function [Babesia microti strain RI]|eukprot:XP_021337647.1 conserved Plasmodium protein, unknown function [Babesia microti strain RI]